MFSNYYTIDWYRMTDMYNNSIFDERNDKFYKTKFHFSEIIYNSAMINKSMSYYYNQTLLM